MTIYLDNAATTQTDPCVWRVMADVAGQHLGNPHTLLHMPGRKANTVVENARSQIAQSLNVSADEIVFTSGATEANNLAILGLLLQEGRPFGHAITCTTEHPSVLACFREFERLGGVVTRLPVGPSGRIAPEILEQALRSDTRLVSVMLVSNETGVIQPIETLAQLCRQRGVCFHTDLTQAVGKLPLPLQHVDMASFSGHKAHGPIGVGALFVRTEIRLKPSIFGGGQEFGMRSGTLSPMLCAGLGKAVHLACDLCLGTHDHLQDLEDLFHQHLLRGLPELRSNGDQAHKIPGLLNLTFPQTSAADLMGRLKSVIVSSGSACASASGVPSHVLRAMGIGAERIDKTIRVSFSRFSTRQEAQQAACQILDALH